MSGESPKFKEKFGAEVWSGVYDFPERDNKYFIFRHGSELVADICSKVSQSSEVWLDIGCGTGHLSAELSEMGLFVVGMDFDQKMIEFAGSRFLGQSVSNKLKFIQASAYHLPFNDNKIDGIVATSLAGCLSSPYEFFQEIYRVLRRDGVAIITFTNRNSLLLKINWYLRMVKHLTEKSTDGDYNYRLYSSAEVMDDLHRIGFEVQEIRHYNFFLNVGNWLIPPKALSLYFEGLGRYKISRLFGRNFVIVAKKIN